MKQKLSQLFENAMGNWQGRPHDATRTKENWQKAMGKPPEVNALTLETRY